MYTYPESNLRAGPMSPRPIPSTVTTPASTSAHTTSSHHAMSGSSSTTPIPTSASTSTSTAHARAGRSYDAYPIRPAPREVSPGIMDDGTISATHPLVQKFLAYTARKFLVLHETEGRALTYRAAVFASAAAAANRRSKSSNKTKAKAKTAAQKARTRARERAEVEAALEHWHGQHKDPRVTRWRCMRGGCARVEDVHDALGPGITDRLAAAIFALAALSVYSFWAKPVHWAFWAVNIVKETAGVVHEVVRADPRDITVPDDVAWVDAEMAVRVLRVWHGGFIPYQPKESEDESDEEKDSDDGEARVKNTNGKRTAVDDGPATPAKRTRTKEPQNLTPTRQSARIRKAAQVESIEDDESDEMVVDVIESSQVVPISEPVDVEPEEMAIDVVEYAEVSAAAEPEASQARAPTVAPSAKKSRSKPSRPRKPTGGRNPRAPRKSRTSAGDVPSEPQLPATPSPSSSAPCTIRIPPRSAPSSTASVPALRELLDSVLPPPPQQVLSGPPASGETTATASRESTAVGTPFSGLSTRVGTPLPDVDVKAKAAVGKAKAKVVREIVAPVRTSARIRAKGLAGPGAGQ